MSETVIPKKTYFSVWAALLVLLGLTVGVSYIHLGVFNAVAAVAIAGAKAMIIIMYFMHVRYSRRTLWVFVGAGFLWLVIMFTFSFGDYFTRPYMPLPTIWNP